MIFIDTHDMFKVDKSEIASPEGHLKFDFFLKLYKSSMMWNKILFLETKREMIKERRSLLTDSPVASRAYKQICQEMVARDEKVMQDVLDALLTRIGVENGDF